MNGSLEGRMIGSLESTKWWLAAWRPQEMMIAGDKYVWEKNLKNSKTLRSTKRDTTSTSKNNPGFPRKIGIARKQSEISENLGLPENSQRLATPRSQPLGLVQPNWRKMKDVTRRRNCSKDRYSRRTQRIRNLMQCIFMFCIVLQSCVYLYTQFQNPPRLVNCWISLKFTGKTIKNTFTLSQILIP